MKKMLPVLVLGFIFFQSCQKRPVGFLMTEYAGYVPDSLVLKSVLDTSLIEIVDPLYTLYIEYGLTPEVIASFGVFPTMKVFSNEEDYRRNKFRVPWSTSTVQGLKGTAPIRLKVLEVSPVTPESEKLKNMITIRGSSGVMTIPFDHGLSAGRYKVSLRFSNEGWTKDLKDVFTFIIE